MIDWFEDDHWVLSPSQGIAVSPQRSDLLLLVSSCSSVVESDRRHIVDINIQLLYMFCVVWFWSSLLHSAHDSRYVRDRGHRSMFRGRTDINNLQKEQRAPT